MLAYILPLPALHAAYDSLRESLDRNILVPLGLILLVDFSGLHFSNCMGTTQRWASNRLVWSLMIRILTKQLRSSCLALNCAMKWGGDKRKLILIDGILLHRFVWARS